MSTPPGEMYTLRATAAMIQNTWPGRYRGNLALRLEELAQHINSAQYVEHPEEEGWRTSSRSQLSGECVEVSCATQTVGVRDTKDYERGTLTFTPQTWMHFLKGLV